MKKKKNELVALVRQVDNIPVVSTLDMCGPLGVEHHAIVQLVKKYELQLKEIGPVAFQMRVGTRGGTPISFCYLDEEQATFLITLMKNSEPVVKFKYRLSREFHRMKKEIARLQSVAANNRLNIEWQETRESGKPVRREETDSIQRFVNYAASQGSQSARMYYMLFSKMANSLMFDVQTNAVNTRDVCNVNQLGSLKVVDTIITRALEEDMAQGIPYKTVYQNAKSKVLQFVSLYGRSTIPGDTLRIGG
jgi:phage regulator Rha-like protein